MRQAREESRGCPRWRSYCGKEIRLPSEDGTFDISGIIRRGGCSSLWKRGLRSVSGRVNPVAANKPVRAWLYRVSAIPQALNGCGVQKREIGVTIIPTGYSFAGGLEACFHKRFLFVDGECAHRSAGE
jgi:hypothetical protein